MGKIQGEKISIFSLHIHNFFSCRRKVSRQDRNSPWNPSETCCSTEGSHRACAGHLLLRQTTARAALLREHCTGFCTEQRQSKSLAGQILLHFLPRPQHQKQHKGQGSSEPKVQVVSPPRKPPREVGQWQCHWKPKQKRAANHHSCNCGKGMNL